MTTNLKTVKSHPAALLRTSGAFGDDAYADAMATGAKVLRGYEKLHGVTFAALDNDALENVRSIWTLYIEHGSDFASGVASAVGELLGLGDD